MTPSSCKRLAGQIRRASRMAGGARQAAAWSLKAYRSLNFH